MCAYLLCIHTCYLYRTEDRGGSGKRLFTVASVKTPSSRACGDEGQSTGKQPTSQTVMGAESTGNTISWAEKCVVNFMLPNY